MQSKYVKLCAFGARYTHSNLALHCLASAVPFDIEIIEANINQRIERVVEQIAKGNPDAVGFSCYIWSIERVLQAASSLKKILPDCLILLGGPEVSLNSEALMQRYSFIDMIIRGGGEIPFAHFMQRLHEDKSILDTPSACVRDGSNIVTTQQARDFDMNDLPFIYDDLSAYENKIIYYETSRGCPYRCAYCMSADMPTALLDIERVETELEFFLRSNVRRVKLTDRTFNYPPERAQQIWRTLISLSQMYPHSTTNFHFEISAVLLTDESLLLLKKAKKGLIQLEVGIQTTNKESLGAINRNHDMQKVIGNTRALCELKNIHVHVDLIAGLPNEDYASFSKSFDEVYSLGADQVQLGFLKVLRGAPIFEMTEQYEIVYTDYPPYEVLSTHMMTYAELRDLHRIAELVDTMHNTGNFAKTLEQVAHKSPFAFFERFAAFAQSEGYYEKPQGKHVLYELMAAFARGENTTHEALVYDWLCLEKPKRWPKGLAPNQPDKSTLRLFYNECDNLEGYASLSSGQRSSRSFVCTFSHLFAQETSLLFDYAHGETPTIHTITI